MQSTSPDETLDASKDDQTKTFEQSGIYITDDDITIDIATTTGLRKTGFSANLYGDDGVPKPVDAVSKIPRSPNPVRRKSVDMVCTDTITTGLGSINRKTPVYRSVRKPTIVTKEKKEVVKDNNTWSGRTKKRPTFVSDTFNQTPTANTTTNGNSSFSRNSSVRASQTNLYDKNGRRIKSTTTSPTKTSTSPLAQQILEAAGNAKNDAQILEKMKTLLSKYTVKSKNSDDKTKEYDDFTTAWVNSNGTLDGGVSTSCSSSPTKMHSKRSSAASSIDSTNSKDVGSLPVLSPRRDRGLSRIPAPIRQNTELY